MSHGRGTVKGLVRWSGWTVCGNSRGDGLREGSKGQAAGMGGSGWTGCGDRGEVQGLRGPGWHPVQRSTSAGAGAEARPHPRAGQVPGGEVDPPTGAGRWTGNRASPPGRLGFGRGLGGGPGSFFVERDFERRLRKEQADPPIQTPTSTP